jgi:hypothetical protein
MPLARGRAPSIRTTRAASTDTRRDGRRSRPYRNTWTNNRGKVISIAVAIGVAVIASGCDLRIDPGDRVFAITFVNDTDRAVHVKLCTDPSCDHFGYSHRWQAREAGQENVMTGPGLTRWRVVDASGATLGCIPLEFEQKIRGVTVRLSEAVTCPGAKSVRFTHE